MKYKLRAIAYLLLAIILILLELVGALGLLFLVIDGSSSYNWYKLGYVVLSMLKVSVAVILVIKSVRLFRLKKDMVLQVSKIENIILLVLILLAWIVLPFILEGEKDIKPLSQDSDINMAIEEKIKSISPTVASLPPNVIEDLGVAYKTLRMLYENEPPQDFEEYFLYTKCAKHIVDEVALPQLSQSKRDELQVMVIGEKFTSFRENNFSRQPPLFLALQSLVGNEVGENKIRRYLVGGMVDTNLFYSPSKDACQTLNIPEKYKI